MLRALAANPAKMIRAVPGEYQQRYQERRRRDGPALTAEVDEAWDHHLHDLLGAPWPCAQAEQLDAIMADINSLLASRGLKSGRFTYGWYSDAEILLCRTVWCVVLHTRPEVVVETGVAHGVTSRIVLEGLSRNESGHLWSIDLPFPFDHRLHGETGVVVTEACRGRWSYVEGASGQRLRPLTAEIGHMEMFIHDSLHTAKNTLFEMEQAASVMSPGGVMLIDDIGGHDGFSAFAHRHPQYQTIICPSADRVGTFGIAVNSSDGKDG